MTDSKQKESKSSATYVEDDRAETVFGYGDGKGPVALTFVVLAWIGYIVGLVSYLYLYYFPDLAEWRAW
jgi:hypothetical protein